MYKDYIKERLGREMIETEEGFVTYAFNCLGLPFTHIYVEDIYVKKSSRMKHVARSFMDAMSILGKEKGVDRLIGSVCVGANGSDNSLRAAIAYDMKLLSANANAIYLYKDLK